MKTKHTSGPWAIAGITRDGSVSLQLGSEGDAHITHWPSAITTEARIANCHLMAAAPDLLESLKKMVIKWEISTDLYYRRAGLPNPKNLEPEFIRQARAAIAKATLQTDNTP